MIASRGGKQFQALDTVRTVYTCSTGDVASGAAINGVVFDRLGLVSSVAVARRFGKNDYGFNVQPFCWVWTTVGSTQINRTLQIDVKLQHGDSSGGGDMADYSTQDQPATSVLWNGAMTTDMQNWSTGVSIHGSNPCDYELTGAKRYIRAVGIVTKVGNSTSTAAGSIDLANALLGITLEDYTYSYPAAASSSSSTST